MTIGELIEELRGLKPNLLLTVDTLGFNGGVFPIKGWKLRYDATTKGIPAVILEPSAWPGRDEC